FDQRVAAAVRFGEAHLQKGETPGEVQLELLLDGSFDELVVQSAAPVLEALHEERLAEEGFRRWLTTRPLRSEPSLSRFFSETGAGILGAALAGYLISRYGLWFLEVEGIGATALALILTPLFYLPLCYLTYRTDRVQTARRVDGYRRLLGLDPPSVVQPSRLRAGVLSPHG
ncbi:MAG: hypothetical protein AAGF23_15050, partial [Acidobacteriota bacterium]